MNEETKFLALVFTAAAVGVAIPLTIYNHLDNRRQEKHVKHMHGIYRAHVKVLDKANIGDYRDKPANTMIDDFDFFCITKDLEK